ncbi:ribose-phosphate pyrophosphokinase [Hymenobacter qilianensis]|uniref:ribose-phosphate diphosphokinase n=2 Tax=Hymenobacter qilianensis TaxID=1385715 RepID=A0A7H0GWN8_9BACT|nr:MULTISPECIES: ribose-phosphate pyrophosphokinase [Hymenobacter]MBC6607087.1 ribose-phosphate pyrophosphokinase [Hymenobacter sp. BT188]QNP52704.1 ribose-phosphate pyrophosphokinase [Hymenobacter qilianensis]GGF69929.1 ribose-phosphate pyrophosphokinase [Hymenobacter qilianensis]
MSQQVKLFAGNASHELGEKIAAAYGTQLGDLSLQRFADTELGPSFNESVRGCAVFLIQSTFPPAENLMELMLMVDAAKRASAASVTIVMPYYGYARQDRKDKPRVSIGAKVVADFIQSVGTDRLMTCDLHAGQIQGFFDIPVDHLDGSAMFVPYIKSLNLENLIFASPDVGGVVRTRAFAKRFGAEIVVCDKTRLRANEIASMQVIGDVTGQDVVLVDDIVDTAGTICKAAELLLERGARSVRAVITHPVLSGPAHDRIRNSVLEELVVSDTIPLRQENPKIRVISLADLFAHAIRNVVTHESISSLFT